MVVGSFVMVDGKIDLENVQYNLELGCCYYSEQVDGTRFDLTSSADLCPVASKFEICKCTFLFQISSFYAVTSI